MKTKTKTYCCCSIASLKACEACEKGYAIKADTFLNVSTWPRAPGPRTQNEEPLDDSLYRID